MRPPASACCGGRLLFTPDMTQSALDRGGLSGIQATTNGFQKLPARGWLGDKVLSFLQRELPPSDVRAVAAGENDAQPGFHHSQAGGKIPPADAFGHDDVGQQELDILRFPLPDFKSLHSVRSFQDLMAKLSNASSGSPSRKAYCRSVSKGCCSFANTSGELMQHW